MSVMSHMKYMLLGAAAVLGVALVAGMPLQSALPLAIFLACPLMMVFMMGGHGGHETEHDGNQASGQRNDSTNTHHHDR